MAHTDAVSIIVAQNLRFWQMRFSDTALPKHYRSFKNVGAAGAATPVVNTYVIRLELKLQLQLNLTRRIECVARIYSRKVWVGVKE